MADTRLLCIMLTQARDHRDGNQSRQLTTVISMKPMAPTFVLNLNSISQQKVEFRKRRKKCIGSNDGKIAASRASLNSSRRVRTRSFHRRILVQVDQRGYGGNQPINYLVRNDRNIGDEGSLADSIARVTALVDFSQNIDICCDVVIGSEPRAKR